ncbi:hypothetical protein [Priestia taiwanensis]|uniref:Uncharacterized protein n=1 Tax=Priestia taiwanensis TaxID=1347902 RepID=A0A917AVS2_9BACI|nr:hypothetical protein [Priestia taiwanensis]MBM7364744.1 hypothetical protein [Priestia taiwanensis]GGE79279.1 hypothetical protein GCM10007140_31080 [Priestia taiwanensis]
MEKKRENDFEFNIIHARNKLKEEARTYVAEELTDGEEILHILATSNEEVKAMQATTTMASRFGMTMDFGVHTIVTVTNNRLLLSYFDATNRYIETISYAYDEVRGITVHTEHYSKLECLYISCRDGKSYILHAGTAHYEKLFDVLRTIPAAEILMSQKTMVVVQQKVSKKNTRWNIVAAVLFCFFAMMTILMLAGDK